MELLNFVCSFLLMMEILRAKGVLIMGNLKQRLERIEKVSNHNRTAISTWAIHHVEIVEKQSNKNVQLRGN